MGTDHFGLECLLNQTRCHGAILRFYPETLSERSIGHVVPIHAAKAGMKITGPNALGLAGRLWGWRVGPNAVNLTDTPCLYYL
jgi:hypothetical protein